jgi:hypothetical protein
MTEQNKPKIISGEIEEEKASGRSIAALVTGIAGLSLNILTIIFGLLLFFLTGLGVLMTQLITI